MGQGIIGVPGCGVLLWGGPRYGAGRCWGAQMGGFTMGGVQMLPYWCAQMWGVTMGGAQIRGDAFVGSAQMWGSIMGGVPSYGAGRYWGAQM